MYRRRVFSRLLALIFTTWSTGAVSVNAQDQHHASMHDSGLPYLPEHTDCCTGSRVSTGAG